MTVAELLDENAMKKFAALLAATAAVAGCLVAQKVRSRRARKLKDRVVFITGGSRGLGLATAREFARYGAILALCARNADELQRAQKDLTARGARVHVFTCDLTDIHQIHAVVQDVEAKLGGIDILINNAGIIKVGPFAHMEAADFEDAMAVMFRAPLHMCLASLPSMRRRGGGRIVNIASIGGKVSIPHLLPYSCAKFALVALSEGLRAELAPQGIRVTTIVPGLMRTGSHLNAEFTGDHRNEYAWFAAGATTPFISISAKHAARAIVRATIRGEGERILSIPAKVLARFHGVFPGITAEITALANSLLPLASAGPNISKPGFVLEPAIESDLWKVATWLGRRAAKSLNEVAA